MNVEHLASYFPHGYYVEIVSSPVTPEGAVETTFASAQYLEMKVQQIVQTHPNGIYLYSIVDMPMHGDLSHRYCIRLKGKR